MPKKSFVPQVVSDLAIAYTSCFLIYGSLVALLTWGTISLANAFTTWHFSWGSVAFCWLFIVYLVTQLTKIGLVILDKALTVTLEDHKADEP